MVPEDRAAVCCYRRAWPTDLLDCSVTASQLRWPPRFSSLIIEWQAGTVVLQPHCTSDNLNRCQRNSNAHYEHRYNLLC